ncbi:MAG: hypothetical protein ACRD00_05410, partial [Thermoanaerobaculia bacterium]
MKLTRLAAAAVLALITSCVNTIRSDGDVHRVAIPDLARPVVEAYPAPSQPSDAVKKAVWTRINRDRADNGLSPVAW